MKKIIELLTILLLVAIAGTFTAYSLTDHLLIAPYWLLVSIPGACTIVLVWCIDDAKAPMKWEWLLLPLMSPLFMYPACLIETANIRFYTHLTNNGSTIFTPIYVVSLDILYNFYAAGLLLIVVAHLFLKLLVRLKDERLILSEMRIYTREIRAILERSLATKP